jgi:NAD+ synthase (glutamine-hydrolysing)
LVFILDNRFDHRPFLYRANWSWQFKAIDDELDRITRQGTPKPDHIELESNKTRSDGSYGKSPVEKRQSSPMTFGSTDALLSQEHVTTNGIGITGACSIGNIRDVDKGNLSLKKSHSTGYSKMQVNVMGKIKDRTGVPV